MQQNQEEAGHGQTHQKFLFVCPCYEPGLIGSASVDTFIRIHRNVGFQIL